MILFDTNIHGSINGLFVEHFASPHPHFHIVDFLLSNPKGNRHCKKATTHQITTMLPTSKNVLFPGHNHLPTASTDALYNTLSPRHSNPFSTCVIPMSIGE